ncbi:ABC transporter substrate-binding protein [Ochrobactrum soli]|uniref:Sugar ABC transporter substrate-binding protein n=1 Tax=Ochrobactrum soli TaxID=2448455 RepID=A0A849KWQ7_9HYPH|nr:sugar ABC transporter substrate-binding protein [[Ochrobactrum] soli]NNU62858.1 sugar ABC transporter substrate-binding protein [[Ochrobactrum] soli]
MLIRSLLTCTALVAVSSVACANATLTIATVNNADMIRMQQLTPEFKAEHPDIDVNWVVLEENVLRQKVTTDIATKAGQFDILTIGNYEVPIWAKAQWLLPLDNLGSNYDLDDLLPKVRASLSYENELYAAPFYAESSMTYYRKDLFEKAGLEMPERPTWDFIKEAAEKTADKEKEIYGICLRGKAGWGENINFITAMANSYGARWFDENWNPQFDQPAWKETIKDYVNLMQNYGPPGASTNGATQALSLFATGKCSIFIDATVFASLLSDPKQSQVSETVGFAQSPTKGLTKSGETLWAWALAMPASTKQKEAAEKFIAWATSKEYTDLVAEKYGIINAPPATRASLYSNAEYLKAAPFAQLTLEAIQTADPKQPTVDPVPYVGVQFVAIPEFQAIGTNVGQQFSAAVAGSTTVDQALKNAQALTTRTMKQAGYPKE